MDQVPVTVVVATYNRPDVLLVALRSALAQQPRVQEILVVGDRCDAATAAACAALSDPRVRYVNLPRRFGEQSGPNSVGMLLARTPYVALLNQDDVWLPGHVAGALAALRAGADLYLGRAADARGVRTGPVPRPEFGLIHPPVRRPASGYSDNWMIEPASAWVLRRDLVERVGTWRPAQNLYRPPIQDWYLRAWRAGVRIAFGTELSVLKVTTHYRRDGVEPAYRGASPEHLALERWLHEVDAAAARQAIAAEASDRLLAYRASMVRIELLAAGPLGTARAMVPRAARRGLHLIANNALTARLYRSTGIDARSSLARLARRRRGKALDRGSRLRTGDPLPEPPDLADTMRLVTTDSTGA